MTIIIIMCTVNPNQWQMFISFIAYTVTYVCLPTIHFDSVQGQIVLSHVAAAAVFLYMTSPYLTARLALFLCIDVDGGLIDTCECVVPWIVSGGKKREKSSTSKICVHSLGLCWNNILIYTYTEQYGLFLWLTKLLAVRTILQTSQWKHALCQF